MQLRYNAGQVRCCQRRQNAHRYARTAQHADTAAVIPEIERLAVIVEGFDDFSVSRLLRLPPERPSVEHLLIVSRSGWRNPLDEHCCLSHNSVDRTKIDPQIATAITGVPLSVRGRACGGFFLAPEALVRLPSGQSSAGPKKPAAASGSALNTAPDSSHRSVICPPPRHCRASCPHAVSVCGRPGRDPFQGCPGLV